MQIRSAEKSDHRVWDEYVLAHPQGLAYQLYAWKDAVENAYRFPGVYLIALENGKARGVLPMIVFRNLMHEKKLISLPYCDAGGVLADHPGVTDALMDEAIRYGVQSGATKLVIRSTRLLEDVADPPVEAQKVRMLLPLPDNSRELMSEFKAKLRSQIKKPMRDGLFVKLGRAECLDHFYSVFTENMRFLGSPVHARNWLKSIIAAYGERALFGVVYLPDGSPAAAGLVLLHDTTVSIPWASSLRRYNSMNPNVLLYWRFLEFSADNGYCRFDFGRSTPGEGTYKFKEQWGARPEPLYWYTINLEDRKNISTKVSGTGLSRMIFRNIWSRSPQSVCNTLGPLIRRHIDL